MPLKAKAFYGTIAATTLIGASLNSSLNPVKALFWCAMLNGVVTVSVMVMLLAAGREVMGRFTVGLVLEMLGRLAKGANGSSRPRNAHHLGQLAQLAAPSIN